jgi:hypothetical protein
MQSEYLPSPWILITLPTVSVAGLGTGLAGPATAVAVRPPTTLNAINPERAKELNFANIVVLQIVFAPTAPVDAVHNGCWAMNGG